MDLSNGEKWGDVSGMKESIKKAWPPSSAEIVNLEKRSQHQRAHKTQGPHYQTFNQ